MRAMTSLLCWGKPRVPTRAESSTGLALASTRLTAGLLEEAEVAKE
jgi:hypothetical protein